jgi:hypothetical protein
LDGDDVGFLQTHKPSVVEPKNLGPYLGDTVTGSRSGSGNVGAVAMTVRRSTNEGGTPAGATPELSVGCKDTGVDDVDVDALAGRIVVGVGVGSGTRVLVGKGASLSDPLKTPGGIGPKQEGIGR